MITASRLYASSRAFSLSSCSAICFDNGFSFSVCSSFFGVLASLLSATNQLLFKSLRVAFASIVFSSVSFCFASVSFRFFNSLSSLIVFSAAFSLCSSVPESHSASSLIFSIRFSIAFVVSLIAFRWACSSAISCPVFSFADNTSSSNDFRLLAAASGSCFTSSFSRISFSSFACSNFCFSLLLITALSSAQAFIFS